DDINRIIKKLEDVGLKAHISKGKERTIIGAIGDERILREQPLGSFHGVENVVPILKPYKLVSREFQSEDTVIDIKGVKIGGNQLQLIAGPCTVESKEILLKTAIEVKKIGAKLLRGGAFKPRTSPYSFQGLGEKGLEYLSAVSKETGLLVVTELMDPRDMELVYKYADIIQIGARNMQNFRLLKEVGKLDKPILLKRGLSATIKEFLMSAEYVASEGNREIILCERGIRTFEESTRNTLDISAIPVLKEETHLPVIVDPSHAVGKWHLVPALAKAAIAAGADGLLIEVHADPENAMCDGSQSLNPKTFSRLVGDLKKISEAVGRSF
ncbi:MAG: 3-deoxy-7-phosphoheptulonate synthase, partial [Thermodesulfobacteriota bacterium]